MPLTNSTHRYGSVAKSFHWLTALLIVTLIPLGIYANGLPYATSEQLSTKAWMFSLHKTLGVTVFFVAVARIGWAVIQPKPGPLHPQRRIETGLAAMVHWLLYGSLLLVPLSGWVHHAATAGFAPIWWPFGQNLPFVPKSEPLADLTAGLHIVFERVLAASILLHVAGALKHQFIDRDATLRRMWFSTTNAPETAPHTGGLLPFAAAVLVWAGAVATGSALGLYAHESTQTQIATLEDVSSDWQVTDGTLQIVVRQLGTDVTGSFENWTADITFDDTAPLGQVGRVEVTVAIGSLTLGSVTSQALGVDYFDAQTHPTAVFFGVLIALDDDRFEATGSLTIKGQSIPLTLPFTLDIADATARMAGQVTLDRRSFGIGDTMTDEASLGFGVDVRVALTAQRTD